MSLLQGKHNNQEFNSKSNVNAYNQEFNEFKNPPQEIISTIAKKKGYQYSDFILR